MMMIPDDQMIFNIFINIRQIIHCFFEDNYHALTTTNKI